MLTVHNSRNAQGRVLDIICWERLIKRVVAHYVWILCKPSRSGIPVRDELVIKVVDIIEEGSKASY